MTKRRQPAASQEAAERVRYTGELASPVVEPGINSGLPGNSALSKNFAKRSAAEKLARKLHLLFAWYQIDDDDSQKCWSRLAIALALDHVPGMKIVESERSRKPSFWKDGGYRLLIEDLDAIRSHGRMTIPQAIEALKKQKPVRWQKRHSLEARLREARSFVADEQAQKRRLQEASAKFAEELRLSNDGRPSDDLADRD